MNEWWDASQFVVRSSCGPGWQDMPGLMTSYIAANLVIFVCYMVLPGLITLLWYRQVNRPKVMVSWHVFSWVVFILCCGIGHLVENVGAFWYPNYRLFTAVHWVTATASVFTAVTFPAFVMELIKRPTLTTLDLVVKHAKSKLESELRTTMRSLEAVTKLSLTQEMELLKAHSEIDLLKRLPK